jgi:hypothetical protein
MVLNGKRYLCDNYLYSPKQKSENDVIQDVSLATNIDNVDMRVKLCVVEFLFLLTPVVFIC